MSNPKRLHPAAMIFSVIHSIKTSIFSLLPIVILAIGEAKWIYVVIAAGALVTIIIISSILSWLRYTYQLEEDQIRIEQGVLIRKKRTISKHRIQSIDLSQNIIHRIFGLTKVQIETAGNDHKIDATLHAVTMDEGKMVHDQLKYNQVPKDIEVDTNEHPEDEKKHPSRKITPKALIIAGSTSGSFGVILGLIGLGFSEIESIIPDRYYNHATDWVFSQAIQILILLAIVALIILWLLGILVTLIQYWDFTITRYEKELFITRGLLEKKQSTIPLKRIQAVGVVETIIHQPLGLAKIYVDIASGEMGSDSEMHTVLFPLIRKSEVQNFLRELLPEYEYNIDQWISLPKRALPYYLFRLAILPLIVTIVFYFTLTDWAYIPLIVTILACLLAYFQYKTIGYEIKGEHLFIRNRDLSKDTIIVKHRRLQAMKKKQHFIQKKQNLASLDTAILNKFLGRHFIVRDLEQEDVDKISDWYSYQKNRSNL